MPNQYVLAADVGATHSRFLLASLDGDGTQFPVVKGAGYNARSSGEEGRRSFFAALGATLDALGPGDAICSAVFGMSGAGSARHAEIQETVVSGLSRECEVRGIALEKGYAAVMEDLLTAFLAGLGAQEQAHGTGILLLSGSGAGAVAYHNRCEVRRIDAMGWLLGDLGSGVWLGRKALEAAAADLDHRGPATSLTERVLSSLGIEARAVGEGLDIRQQLIRAAYDLPPSAWGRFAPHVSALADPGTPGADGVATSIAAEAVEHLLAHVERLAESPTTVVLAGSVLTEEGPISRIVRYALENDGHTVFTAEAPLHGALAIAREFATSKSGS